MNFALAKSDSDNDTYFCENCSGTVLQSDKFCRNCCTAFVEEVKCSNHSEKVAEYFCVVCAKPLCQDCAVYVDKRYRCADHQQVEIREGWAKTYAPTTYVEAQFIEQLLTKHQVPSKMLSNTMGSNYGAIRLWQLSPVIPFMVARWLGGGEIKIFIPANKYDQAAKLLAEFSEDSF